MGLEEFMGWESSDVVRFDLGALLQGQIRVAKLKSAYISLVRAPRCKPSSVYDLCSGRSHFIFKHLYLVEI